MENQFPSNSHTEKKDLTANKAPAAKKVEKIVTGTVTTRKKPLGRKLKDFIAGEDAKNAVFWVWSDVLVPGVRDLAYDALTSGVERRIYGESRGRGRRGLAGSAVQTIFGNAAYNPYNRYSASSSSLRPEPRQSMPNRRGRAQMRDLAEIIFETRAEASEVLDAMIAIIAQYDSVSVADLWDLLGRTGEPTDEKWGWTELLGADVSKVHEGYLLDLPRPSALD